MMHYLTVQDILWINLQLTEHPQRFDYASLEEATFYQYAYGESARLVDQAVRFFKGFTAKRPLATGNEATAFVGMATFLEVNGRALTLSDKKAIEWCAQLLSAGDGAAALIESATAESPDEHQDVDHLPEIAPTARAIMDRYPKTIESLLLAPSVPR